MPLKAQRSADARERRVRKKGKALKDLGVTRGKNVLPS